MFLEAVMSKLFVAEEEKPDMQEGIDLLQQVLAYEMQVCLILELLVSLKFRSTINSSVN